MTNIGLPNSQLTPSYPVSVQLHSNMFKFGSEHIPPFIQGLLEHSIISEMRKQHSKIKIWKATISPIESHGVRLRH